MARDGKWEKAQAKIVDYHSRRDNLTGGYITDYVVDVQTADGAAFRATVRHRNPGGWQGHSDFAAPSKGEIVGVLFDRSSQNVKFDRDDPRLSERANRRARDVAADERLRQAAEQPPGTPNQDESSPGVMTIGPGDSMTFGP